MTPVTSLLHSLSFLNHPFPFPLLSLISPPVAQRQIKADYTGSRGEVSGTEVSLET